MASDGVVSVVKWTSVLLQLVLFAGCGSILTLVSCLYIRGLGEDLLDWVTIDHKALQFGFPAPVFHSYAMWGVNQMAFVAEFRWEGALIDVALYSIIAGVVFLFVQRIARAIVTAELK